MYDTLKVIICRITARSRSCWETPDGDGNVLDHSMILFGSGMSESDNHDPKNLSLLVARNGVDQVKGTVT